jgi:hypothetical protein
MGARECIFEELLGLLTPEGISDLTSVSTVRRRQSLTDIINQRDEGFCEFKPKLAGNSANILPFKRVQDNGVELYSHWEFKTEKNENVIPFIKDGEEGKELEIEIKVEVELSGSDFIISEKEKMISSNENLKKGLIIELYNEEMKLDIEQEKIYNEDMKKSANTGVLIDKKQY